jgi:uncharacterized protein (DUF58 family)
MHDERTTDVELRWSASSLARTLTACAGLALVLAGVCSRWQLVVFAAPMLGVLASRSWQRRPPSVAVRSFPGLQRCFEEEEVTATIDLQSQSADLVAELEVTGVSGMQTQIQEGSTAQHAEVTACAPRWGRYPLRARVRMEAPGGLWCGTATVDVADVYVFPLAPPQSTPVPRTELPDRLGTHLTRHIGPGVEFADIRPYLPGDQLRAVNWAVSARRGALHVTQRLTDRAADVVVLVDMSAQPAGPATTATERALRGATQVVQTALRNGDRAGVVGLGGSRPRWLNPDIGRRQFYRVLDAALAAGSEYHSMTGTLAPRAAVPPGAVVVAFSTLLDTNFALALIDLRERGHTVVAVDVMEGWPFEGDDEPILERMWALQRSAMYRDMRVVGVEVISWPTDVTVDQAMRLVPPQPTARRRRT